MPGERERETGEREADEIGRRAWRETGGREALLTRLLCVREMEAASVRGRAAPGREQGLGEWVWYPVRIFILVIYLTLGIGLRNGSGLGQNFRGEPYKITTFENRLKETVVLRCAPL
jgi:hypothetical protein